MPDRSFDLVLFGATGFTGSLVAAYLARQAPEGLSWAIAGRDEARLRTLAHRLGRDDLPVLVADSHDPEGLQRLAADTRVIGTTVGPYLRHGFELARACAVAGTHYADLTGEVPFMQRTIRALHDTAQRTGARIVHTCGYDSIPSDMGAFLLQQDMLAKGAPAKRVRTFVGPAKGGLSGGTLASLMEVMALAEDRRARRAMADPYALDPEDDRGTTDTWDPVQPAFDPWIDQEVAPFMMGPVNTRVVRRSHALLGRPWGDDFSYTEVMAMGTGLKGKASAWGLTLGLGAVLAAASRPAMRELLERRVLPAAGTGPDEAQREAGFFRHLTLGVGADPSHRRAVRIVGHKDPGYGATAIMLSEACLSLATQPEALPDAAGVLTPSTGIGNVLIDRLRAAGMTWSSEPWPEGAAAG